MSLVSCPSCLHRAIYILSQDRQLIPSATHLRRRLRVTFVTRRHHATYESLTKGHHRRILRETLSKKKLPQPNARRKGAGSLTKVEIKDALAREKNRSHLLTDPNAKNLTPQERRKELQMRKDVEQFYPDPLQLANAVFAKLRVPNFDDALALVRASEGIVAKNIVSWNHCIDWCMSQGDSDRAWKLYNELKKRGHRPDSHTYTIMLRGLSQNSRKSNSTDRAINVYNSMFAPNSAVTPNTIHTNAVLNVCARKGDLQGLWSIAGRLPEKGPGSPDRWTFTTILNAIRDDATKKVADLLKNLNTSLEDDGGDEDAGLSLEDRQKVIFDEALKDGRKLWADVSHRWRRANLVIDEQLVCAMGRLILGCGTRRDFGEVFDLVDSTMNIRLAERGYKKGMSAEVETELDNVARDTTALAEVHDNRSSSPLSDEQVYASPANNTLSMIIEAATATKEMRIGKAYWHLLTTQNGPYKVAPDADNIISYFRLLRVSRASKDILDILSREWPKPVAEKLYRRGTFVIAMSTCIRDKNNPGVFDTAEKILNIMQDKLEEADLGMYSKIRATENDPNLSYRERKAAAKARLADVDEVTFGEDEALAELQRSKSGVESMSVDPKALRMFIDLAILKTSGWNEGVAGRDNADESFERDPKKNITLRALRRIGPEMVNISRLAKLKILEAEISSRPQPKTASLDFSRNAQKKMNDRAGTRVAEKLEDLIELLRTIVGAYDKVIGLDERFEDEGRPRLDKRLIENYRDLKRRTSGFLSRTKDEVQRITRGDLKYAKWKNRQAQEDDEDLEDDLSGHNQKSRSFPWRSNENGEKREMPKISRTIRQIYDDTDSSLGRLAHSSRRQKFERHQAVQDRMKKRLGVGEDVGILDEDLSIDKKEMVEKRMRDRAFNIRVSHEREGKESVANT